MTQFTNLYRIRNTVLYNEWRIAGKQHNSGQDFLDYFDVPTKPLLKLSGLFQKHPVYLSTVHTLIDRSQRASAYKKDPHRRLAWWSAVVKAARPIQPPFFPRENGTLKTGSQQL